MKMLHFWDNMSRNMQLSKSVRDLRVVWFQNDRPLRKPSRGAKPGGADRDRTDDLRRARAAFSQLNYCPTVKFFCFKRACKARCDDSVLMCGPYVYCPLSVAVVGVAGVEPATSSLSGMRSSRLSYTPTEHEMRKDIYQARGGLS